ncbi:hypothetical protein KAU11_04810 [Candidatus Babeliales bacterium]|nr:hypothetical protein [Candidatus Babeliales bacterium]
MDLFKSFDEAYTRMLLLLHSVGEKAITRKGAEITELFNASFTVADPLDCIAWCRTPNLQYLKNEFAFYTGGSNKLSEAVKLSKFWNKCSDDGKTVNSNYGEKLFHNRNRKGNTQFEHALAMLKNNPRSKKAVMVIYNAEHAFLSNDNPCTMYLHLRMDSSDLLHLTVHMRSNDVYYGLPYDVPFFCFVQYAMLRKLQEVYPAAEIGTYTHTANSLHKYSYKEKQIESALSDPAERPKEAKAYVTTLFENNYRQLQNEIGIKRSPAHTFMTIAWNTAKNSTCLKKKVGCVLTFEDSNGDEKFFNSFPGSPIGAKCLKCAREDKLDPYFGDECPSVHGEMRCILDAMKYGRSDFSKATMYTTHNSCDACAKLCNAVGLKRIIYDKPYKINEKHWPNIEFIQVGNA